jgi:hypothetical protein
MEEKEGAVLFQLMVQALAVVWMMGAGVPMGGPTSV